MRIRSTPGVIAALSLMTATTMAFAQSPESECPPGSWFCEETPAPQPPPDLPPPTVTPPPQQSSPTPSTTVVVPGVDSTPPVVVYQSAPPAPAVVVVRRPTHVASPPPPPKPRARHRFWGFNTRLVGIMMDNGQDESAGMGGVGFSLRIRPEPYFVVDIGLDMLGGKDYQGHRRAEVPFSLSGIFFANPKSATQFYVLGGLDWSHARVEIDDRTQTTEEYSYFGGHLGPGLEFRLSHPVSLNIDLLGFIRGRTDRLAASEPEFTDERTGQTTNTSGGGLFRVGVTFYW